MADMDAAGVTSAPHNNRLAVISATIQQTQEFAVQSVQYEHIVASGLYAVFLSQQLLA